MNKEESRTDFGTVRIHKNVIVSIAGIAAGEIEGVKRLGKDFKSGLLEFLGKKSISAISVDIDKNGEVKLEIPIVVKYGFNIPDTKSRLTTIRWLPKLSLGVKTARRQSGLCSAH